MNKKKNITYISNIKKAHYYTFSIKKKNEKEKKIDNKNKRKIKIIQTLNISPLALSLEKEKDKKISLFKIEKNPINIKILNNKLGRKYKYIQKGKLKIINNKLSFSGISTNNTFESNNEIKNINIINGQNHQNNINFCIEHRKILFSNSINYPMNKNKKNKVKNNSYINVETPKKYKTIFTKFNRNSNNNINIFEEPNYYFEIFSSKYNNNNKEEKTQSEFNNKLFNNEEINKVAFHKFYSSRKNKKYYETEISSNSDNICLEKKYNYINFPNFEIMKNFKELSRPIISSKNKSAKINLKLILQKVKNNTINNIPIFEQLPNKQNDLKSDLPLKYKHYKNSNGVKYSPINLNMLAQIPNRIILIDNHGNEINHFNNNKNKQNDNIKINSLKQNFGDIKILRKQFLDIYHSGNTRNNSKTNLDTDYVKIPIPKSKILKMFHNNNVNYLNIQENSNKKNNIVNNNSRNYFLSGKLREKTKKYFLNLKISDKMEINLIS